MLTDVQAPAKSSGEVNGNGEDKSSNTPSSVEMKNIQHSNGAPLELLKPPPPRNQKGKKKLKISKDMIKRVEGGGMGRVNPMGWYDRDDEETHHTSTPPVDTSAPVSRRSSRDRDVSPGGHAAETNGRDDGRLSLKREARLGEDTENAIDEDSDGDGSPPLTASPRAMTPEE